MAGQFRTVKCSVIIAAAPEAVFEALTVAEKLAGWWPSAAETEPKPGGKVLLIWSKNKNRNDASNRCETQFTTFDPPRQVTYWSVTFTLEPLDGGNTKVTISDNECPADDAGLISVALTWGSLRLNLKTYVERGLDMRSDRGFGAWGA
jgi:uncharacterized protein YndB with AHSA1/START domain